MATTSIHPALQAFAANVTAKSSQLSTGEAEDQLRTPFDTLICEAAKILVAKASVCTGEPQLPGGIGKPDYAVHIAGYLVGYAELKAPGVGASPDRYTGHNKQQFRRFSAIPNILYTDGNEWSLYRNGERIGSLVRLSGDVATDGKAAATLDNARSLASLLRNFFAWEPMLPLDTTGQIDFSAYAAILAPLCRLLRDEAKDAMADRDSALMKLRDDWRDLLFPNATDEQFADAYAQTATFALLLGRIEGADPLTIGSAKDTLSARHALLSRALDILTDPQIRVTVAVPLDLLVRVIGAVTPHNFRGPRDPWLYFYEDFLAVYDPNLRRDAGVYYTRMEVVRAQVRLIDELLVQQLKMPLGFASPNVTTLDPAVGTGTYLLGVIEQTIARIKKEQGIGVVPGVATELSNNLYGFEQMVGSFAVAELRVSRALRDLGAVLPPAGIRVYLTDTLETPNVTPAQLGLFYEPIAEQRAKASVVKGTMPVIVCLGNPPYDRHASSAGDDQSTSGNWVRWGENGDPDGAILNDFRAPAIAAGMGVHLKNLYNLYVYFWRWALWKVFEQDHDPGPGVVSFITASSFLDGPGFSGMREHMRRVCDEIWIIDCGGEGRGTHQDENLFAIRTPVAITLAVRLDRANRSDPACVRYARLIGSRESKLAQLEGITGFSSVDWVKCPDAWASPFLPTGVGGYYDWPLLIDLMPWQHSGAQFKRTWPIGPDHDTLARRWKGLLVSEDRAAALKETRDRTVGTSCRSLWDERTLDPIAALPDDTPMPPIKRYAYRTLDRQWMIADSRICDYPRPDLWRAHGNRQVYFTSLLGMALGAGPALSACVEYPDLHHFRGSYGGKHVFPLYRDPAASEENITPGILSLLGMEYQRSVTSEDFFAYIYATLAHPAFAAQFFQDPATRELRVPITKDPMVFDRLRAIGARLLWLHTYGERFVDSDQIRKTVPRGLARCTTPVAGDADGYPRGFGYDEETEILDVGTGRFEPVSSRVFAYTVSGLKVVQSWLNYRMKQGKGKTSSPLDKIRPRRWTAETTTELLELLWVLEATTGYHAEQGELLDAVTSGDCFLASELPGAPTRMRRGRAKDAPPGQGNLADQ